MYFILVIAPNELVTRKNTTIKLNCQLNFSAQLVVAQVQISRRKKKKRSKTQPLDVAVSDAFTI